MQSLNHDDEGLVHLRDLDGAIGRNHVLVVQSHGYLLGGGLWLRVRLKEDGHSEYPTVGVELHLKGATAVVDENQGGFDHEYGLVSNELSGLHRLGEVYVRQPRLYDGCLIH
jgi:hypothetical protein